LASEVVSVKPDFEKKEKVEFSETVVYKVGGILK
jgi:hypothetical protein